MADQREADISPESRWLAEIEREIRRLEESRLEENIVLESAALGSEKLDRVEGHTTWMTDEEPKEDGPGQASPSVEALRRRTLGNSRNSSWLDAELSRGQADNTGRYYDVDDNDYHGNGQDQVVAEQDSNLSDEELISKMFLQAPAAGPFPPITVNSSERRKLLSIRYRALIVRLRRNAQRSNNGKNSTIAQLRLKVRRTMESQGSLDLLCIRDDLAHVDAIYGPDMD